MSIYSGQLFLGIDPGKTGGIAALRKDGGIYVVSSMPDTDHELLAFLEGLGQGFGKDAFAFVERVHSMPKQGHVGAFTFGRNVGALHMALCSAGIGFDLITPGTWQAALSCLSGGDKNVTKRRACQLWPRQTITHATADALLIAEFGRRQRLGQLRPGSRR